MSEMSVPLHQVSNAYYMVDASSELSKLYIEKTRFNDHE